MNGNANLNANNLTPKNVEDWRNKLNLFNEFEYVGFSESQRPTSYRTIDLTTKIPNWKKGKKYLLFGWCNVAGVEYTNIMCTTDLMPTEFKLLYSGSAQNNGSLFVIVASEFIKYKQDKSSNYNGNFRIDYALRIK